ncbi:uncharacterized protein SOCE26_090410 [Sorangium cellulosum]|uniref:Uncharacterized protein n=1 Tax=Sorangium cellulosum TaxID=56 RepID=A0A2L0F7I4_SORCE|nr:uncharacterized protein SOCE26_090410 [Sorangium cellulosum]
MGACPPSGGCGDHQATGRSKSGFQAQERVCASAAKRMKSGG